MLTHVRSHAHARGLRNHAGENRWPCLIVTNTVRGRPSKAGVRGVQMSAMTQKIKEHTCAACNGTGFPVVKQPVLATRRIYPVKCEACAGKGRIADAD